MNNCKCKNRDYILCESIQDCCPEYYDIICIGAGASGLYLGYKMVKEKSDKSLLILEKMDRVGGKITSVPFSDKNVKYQAEGCAQRFMNNHFLVKEVIDFFNIGYTPLSNDLIATDTSRADELSQMLLEKYPIGSDKLSEIANVDAITNLPSIEDGSYKNLYEFNDGTGYRIFTEYWNLEDMYNVLFNTSEPVQNFVDGGFKNLFNKMKKYIESKYDIILNKKVSVIEYDVCNNIYIINGEYSCKKVIFTGIQHDFTIINTNSFNIQSLKEKLYNLDSIDANFIRLFVEFDDPWWTNDQIPLNFRDDGPIGNMYYYTKNALVLYSDMRNAYTLYSMIPLELQKYGHNMIKWIKFERAERLKRFLMKYIKELIIKGANDSPDMNIVIPSDDQLKSMYRFAFKFTRQVLTLWRQVEGGTFDDILYSLNNNGNIHIVGGNYTTLTGWVEGAFDSISKNYNNIVNF